MPIRSIVFLFCLFSSYLFASEKVSINPEPLWLYKVNADLTRKPSAKSISDGYYMDLIDHQVNLVNATEYMHFIRHIVNQSGVQNASEVSVTFSPEFQQVVFHKIILIRNGIPLTQLNAREIKVVQEETDASDFQYNGLKRAFFVLKDVRKDDRIEVAYSIVGFNPVFGNRYSDKIYFSCGTARCNYFESIVSPANRTLQFGKFNNAQAPKEELTGDIRIYHWDNPEMKTWESQDGVPLWFDNYPYITVSEFTTWQDVVKWGTQLFRNYNNPIPAALQQKVNGWRSAAKDDPEMFASLAIRFVQDEVRYLGLEMGTYTHQPHTPAEVYEHGYGDCKDKALLLATILQLGKIPAYVAFVNTSLRKKLLEATPSATEFDHAIVAIKRSSSYIYVDPTVTGQRGELVNLYIPDYGYALVLHEGESNLQPVEPGFLNSSSILEELDVSVSDTSRLKVTSTYAGGRADDTRSSFTEVSITDLDKDYTEFYSTIFEGIQQAMPIVIEDDSVKDELLVKEEYAIPTLWHPTENGKESFSIFAKTIYHQIPNPASCLKDAPIRLSFPLTTTYTLQLKMPETWPFSFEELHIKNDSYQFDFEPEAVGNMISLHYYLKTFKDNIPVNEVAKYKSDYKDIVQILELEFYRKNQPAYNPGNVVNLLMANNINWNMVFLTILIVAGLGWLLKSLNNHNTEVLLTGEPQNSISGWLIVLGISLALTCTFQLINFAKSNYFSMSVWNMLHEQGGTKLQYLLFCEMFLSLFWICGNVALIYWFLGRRNIFPKMFIYYTISLAAGQLLLLILLNVIPRQASLASQQPAIGIQLGRTCFYGIIWISYVLRSERVKNTFSRYA